MKLLSDEKKTALEAIPSRSVPTAPSHALSWLPAHPFLRFSHTSQQLHAEGGKAWVRAQRLSYEDGKLSTERFEGELPMADYYQAVDDAQRMFADQTLMVVEQLSSLLSALLLHPGRRE